MESGKPAEERISDIQVTRAGPSQVRLDTLTEKSSRSAYVRLMNTAYTMSQHPTMPLHHFGTLIEVQRKNGVKFISGKFQPLNVIMNVNEHKQLFFLYWKNQVTETHMCKRI